MTLCDGCVSVNISLCRRLQLLNGVCALGVLGNAIAQLTDTQAMQVPQLIEDAMVITIQVLMPSVSTKTDGAVCAGGAGLSIIRQE